MDNVPARIKRFAYDIIYYVMFIIELMLFLRFFLKFVGANPSNPAISFFYSASALFSNPFAGIFGTFVSGNIVFDPSILIAMVGYAIVAQVIIWFVRATEKP